MKYDAKLTNSHKLQADKITKMEQICIIELVIWEPNGTYYMFPTSMQSSSSLGKTC